MQEMKDNRLGLKIKQLRKQKNITQAELVGTKITRNMLSCIESGKANPSLETLEYIAERLDTSITRLLSDEEYDLPLEKKEKLDAIYRAYIGRNYKACIRLITALPSLDDELSYILATARLELGRRNVADGSLNTAIKNLELALESAGNTRLDTAALEARARMLIAIAKNIQSPLLEFDSAEYLAGINATCDFDLYKYITLDLDYSFNSEALKLHAEAKRQIKEHDYQGAVKLLLSAADKVKEEGFNAYIIFNIYTDLENCYKQLYDYEKAYLYSTKRITLLESFKS